MKLKCVSRYSSHFGTFELGQVFDIADDIGGQIKRSSPDSFEEYKEPPPDPDPIPDTSAMSTEMGTGIVAPDRRARGGRRRQA